MPKRKTQKPKQLSPDSDPACCIPTPRRSIPVAEVNDIIEREVNRVKAARTVYDDRVAILNQLADNESYLGNLQDRLHMAQISNKQIRSDLTRINLAITRQLELDGV